MSSNENATRSGTSRVALSVVVFVPLLVLLLLQIPSEGMQVLVGLLATFGFGYAVGHMLQGRSRSTYALVGAALGFTIWVVIVIVSLVFYAGAAAYPVGTWFVRFGLGGALSIAGGALFGDLVARQRFTVTSTFVATAITTAGGIVTIFTSLFGD